MNKRIIAPIALLVTFMAPALAHAEAAAGAAGGNPYTSAIAIGMAIAIGLAALGGGMGQGRAVAAALEGICRNPNSADKVFVPFFSTRPEGSGIGLALSRRILRLHGGELTLRSDPGRETVFTLQLRS